MLVHNNIIGKKFGEVTVLNYDHSEGHITYWNCKCSCGKTYIVARHGLRYSGKRATKSCGCKRNYTTRKKYFNGEPSIRALYSVYVCGARKRNIDFKLSEEEFRYFISMSCFYCGKRDEPRSKYYDGKVIFCNGIDRLDSSKGYIKGNVVPCCKQCNWAKNKFSYSEFKAWVNRVFDNMNSKEIVKATCLIGSK